MALIVESAIACFAKAVGCTDPPPTSPERQIPINAADVLTALDTRLQPDPSRTVIRFD
jgi:hypothetical protein